MDEDWELLTSFLPEGWQEMAARTGALKGLRKEKSPAKLLRTLMIHLGCGHSLRETVVRARMAELGDYSAVALMNRLKKSRDWLHALCLEMFSERGLSLGGGDGFEVRAFDATTVKEPGTTGSLWRIHYSLRLPSLTCDFFKLTGTEGSGTGESLSQFPVERGDHILADRGYSTANGIHHVFAAGGHVTVRVNTGSLRLDAGDGKPLGLLERVSSLDRPHAVGEWPATVVSAGGVSCTGRVCALRKSEQAIAIALEKLRKEASRRGRTLKPETLEYARYVILFTTFSPADFSAAEVLEWYRLRWQVELTFKRFKSLAQLGHLPKYDDDSARAWLYGKLAISLLTEKLVHHANSISPWGYNLEPDRQSKSVA